MKRQKPPEQVYSDAAVVAHYAAYTRLEPCEQALFEKHLRPGLRILDVGVGAGRTTPALSAGAKRYVGIDLSPAMIRECRRRFPGLSFSTMDAASLSAFPDGSFDACVFSFNGIGHLHPDAKRESFWRECARVLVPGGVLIFSAHNAGALFEWPKLSGAPLLKKAWRILRCAWLSAVLFSRRAPSVVFRRGKGYVHDPEHGGIRVWAACPDAVEPELKRFGFNPLEVLDDRFPESIPRPAVQWHYYAARKLAPKPDSA